MAEFQLGDRVRYRYMDTEIASRVIGELFGVYIGNNQVVYDSLWGSGRLLEITTDEVVGHCSKEELLTHRDERVRALALTL